MLSSISTLGMITRSLNEIQENLSSTQKQLSTNVRCLNAIDTGVLVRTKIQITSYTTIDRNLVTYRSAVEASVAGLKQIASLIESCNSLAQEAVSNADLSATDRESLNAELQNLLDQINVVIEISTFNGVSLLSSQSIPPGNEGGHIQTISINSGPLGNQDFFAVKVAASLYTLGLLDRNLNKINVNTVSDAINAQAALQKAVGKIGQSFSSLLVIGTRLDDVLVNNEALINTFRNVYDEIIRPDTSTLQFQLNQLNKHQSINYFVISQLSIQASALMQIFR